MSGFHTFIPEILMVFILEIMIFFVLLTFFIQEIMIFEHFRYCQSSVTSTQGVSGAFRGKRGTFGRLLLSWQENWFDDELDFGYDFEFDFDDDIDEYFFIMLLKGLSSENNAMFFSNNRKSPLRVRVVWQHEFRLSMGVQ